MRKTCGYWMFILGVFGLFLNLEAKVIRAAPLLILKETESSYSLSPYLELLSDPQASWSLAEVMASPVVDQFIPNEAPIPSFHITEAAIWSRFRLKNPLDTPQEWFLELENARLQQITLYAVSGESVLFHKEGGTSLPFSQREVAYRQPTFQLKLEPQQELTIYLRTQSETLHHLPLKLATPIAFFEQNNHEQYGLGLYYGSLLVMALYHICLFFALRERSYFFYVLYILNTGLYQLTYDGFAFEFFWPNSPVWAHRGILILIATELIVVFLFCQSFLNTRFYLPRWHRCMQLGIGLMCLYLPWTFWMDYQLAVRIAGILGLLVPMLVLVISFSAWRSGSRSGLYLVLAWAFLLLSTVWLGAGISGLLNSFVIGKYLGKIATVVQLVLLALAFADRLNQMKLEKEKALQLQSAEAKKVVALNADLQKLDKLKDEFLANISHELRTPLSGIIGLSESILEGIGGPLSPVQAQNLSLIAHSGQRLVGLVNDLLDFSKIKESDLHLQLCPVDVGKLAELVLRLSQPLVGKKNLVLQLDLPSNLPLVQADENRLQQILLNLVGNAIKFTDEGMVTITACAISGKWTGVQMTIRDTGIGVPVEKQEMIFESFTQADGSISREYGGTGLGLSISKQLVELHGGQIWVESTEGQGSAFHFTLPASLEPRIQETLEQPAIPPLEPLPTLPASLGQESLLPSASEHTILVVDDEHVNLQVLQNHLHLQGYRVVTAENGTQALELMEQYRPHLVILDLMMPRMDGYEVLRRLREKYDRATLPVVMLTAKNQVRDLVYGFACGINDYLTKPFVKEELASRVATHLHLRRVLQELQSLNHSLECKVQQRTLELEQAYQQIQSQQTLLNQELEDARRIQEHLLPKKLPSIPGARVACHYQPLFQIGGDFYQILRLDETHYGFLIADVTGHGPSAALMASITAAIFAETSRHSLSPREVLWMTNRMLQGKLPNGCYVSMIYAVYEITTHLLSYTNAGHPPGMVVRATTHESWQLETKGLFLGVLPEAVLGLEEKSLTLQPGDRVLLYSDGLIETRSPENRMMGRERLLECLKAHDQQPIEELLKTIYDLAVNYHGSNEFDDDYSIIGLEVLAEDTGN